MSELSISDKVSMEFLGPVPGILGKTTGYHVVYWVQAAGGASFTRPSKDERDYYLQCGKAAPEWQCEYFDFDGQSWSEAALTVELWRGASKLRSLFAAGLRGRTEAELRAELPELERFILKNGLSGFDVSLTFREALLRAAESAGVIQRGISKTPETNGTDIVMPPARRADSWWRRVWRGNWSSRGAA